MSPQPQSLGTAAEQLSRDPDTRERRETVVGTPLRSNATKVLLLGAGELGKELAISFQRLGVEVHAAERYAGAPAHQVAHFGHVVDLTDAAALRALAEQIQPDYIVPEIEAIATNELVALEAAGYQVIPTANATVLTMNREGIRRLAAETLGLPTSGYAFATSFAEFEIAVGQMGYPCVVKPVMSSSGKGQSVVYGPEDMASAWEHARAGGRVAAEKVIVERFVDFDFEITLLTVRSIDPATGKPATWFCEPIGHRQEGGDYVESWQPAVLSPETATTARSIAARVTAALGGRGLFGVELFVVGEDVFFSEVSPRPHDTGMVTLASQRFSEFDLHARAVLGFPVDVTLTSPGASAVIYAGVNAPALNYSGLERALALPETDVRLFGKPDATPRRRMGVALATAETVEDARARATAAAAQVTITPAAP